MAKFLKPEKRVDVVIPTSGAIYAMKWMHESIKRSLNQESLVWTYKEAKIFNEFKKLSMKINNLLVGV